MRNTIVLSWILFCFSVIFQSCGDDIPLEEQENYIEYKVSCDTPGVQMHIAATGDADGLYVKNKFEKGLNTKEFFAIVEVDSDDPEAFIWVELYVNGKLKAIDCQKGHVFISERLKGTGPFLY